MTKCYQFKKDNEWYTFEKDVKLIYSLIPKNKTIWCPFDTEQSAFVKIGKKMGFNIIHTHLESEYNFYEYEPKQHYDYIISNPPFSEKKLTIERLNKLGKPFIMIYGIQCFNSGGFTRELKNTKQLTMWFICKRLKFHKGIENNKLPSPTFSSMLIGSQITDKQIIILEG